MLPFWFIIVDLYLYLISKFQFGIQYNVKTHKGMGQSLKLVDTVTYKKIKCHNINNLLRGVKKSEMFILSKILISLVISPA